MKRKSARLTYKRIGSGVVIAAMLAQSALPAYAVSPGYGGFVSQVPGVYTAPPDPNVMFTLDDSASMLSDAVPDFLTDWTGMPAEQTGAALAWYGSQFPGLWVAMNNSGALTFSAYLTPTYYKQTNAIARYVRSAAGNPLYYNRTVTYKPWPKTDDDKQFHAPANAAAVNLHPTDPFNTSMTIDLTQRVGPAGEDNGFWPATYYVYTGTTPLPYAKPNDGNNVFGSFTKFEITDNAAQAFYRASTRTDCSGTVDTDGCTRAEELQNFANWLQYYRNRMLMAKGGVATAFAKQGTNLRVGFTTINTGGTMKQGVQTFAGARRTSFYTDLYSSPYSWGGTPLRLAMDQVGTYFKRNDIGNPWAEDPASTTTVGTEYSCRKSFHILSTDGFWNGSGAGGARNDNNDDFSGNTPAKPDGTTYTYSNTVGAFSIDPFRDSYDDTLADVAAYYWKTDLRSTLANNVQTSSRDPAFWQHLTTFTVGLGITGTGGVKRTSDGSAVIPAQAASSPLFPYVGQPWLANEKVRDWLVADKTQLTWTRPSANDPKTGDDLVHAAMNGRGRYYSATNPTELANGLANALSEVTDQSFDLAAVAVDSTQLIAGGHLYQSTYSPSRWYGRLYAFNQNASTGAVNNKPTDATYTNPDQVWEASNKMPAPDSRNIFTYDAGPGPGTPKARNFTWSDLSATQRSYLMNQAVPGSPTGPELADGQARLDYLRGSGTNEIANGGSFRDRSRYTVAGITGGVLGDVVNGSPIKGPDRGGGYDRLPTSDAGKALYSSFRSNGGPLVNMRKTIFLGANDGMLHAFNADDGVERFAYVPNAVYKVPRSSPTGAIEWKLKMLSETTYTHRFTVDGPPNIADAFLGGAWKTLLIASNGAGARGIFTMDVTNTEVGAAAGQFGTGKIMWEFTEDDDEDMGFVTAYPHIARMRDGKWVAIFGNGYDSVNGQAKLYILDLATGAIWKEFSVGAPGNNGLSQPNFLVNAEREVIAIYAGDLRGNLWKFDVNDTDRANWKVAFGTGPNYTPLFSTPLDGSGKPTQPITVMPELTAHTENPASAMISFGTGKLFEASDTAATGNVNLNKQALYGVWDKPGESGGMTVAVLKKHTPNGSITPPAGYGATSTGAPNWSGGERGWYYELDTGGERVNVPPQQVATTLFMLANKPLVDPCASGGSARIFALNAVTGEAPAYAVFDTNDNGTFEASELGLNVRLNATGVLTQPIFQTLTSATAATSTDVGVAPDASVDRGQVTAARLGGVELGRSSPNKDCNWYVTASKSDTTLMKQYLQTCVKSAKARISWRQLM